MLTENSKTEQCVAGQVPVNTRFSRDRSENLVTTNVGSFEENEQAVVNVGKKREHGASKRGNTISDKNVSLDFPQNTSGFFTYIRQVA